MSSHHKLWLDVRVQKWSVVGEHEVCFNTLHFSWCFFDYFRALFMFESYASLNFHTCSQFFQA